MKRILWISDIHLNGNSSSDYSRQVISSFITSIREIEQIDMLIISGDIAKTGGDNRHYSKFTRDIIAPINAHFPNIKIFCVPGNHDVDWGEAQEKFVNYIIKKSSSSSNTIKEFRETITEDYYKKVFMNYNEFHRNVAINNEPSSFSSITEVKDGIAIIGLNSAWLSIGSPVDNLNIHSRTVHRVDSYDIIQDSSVGGNKLLFQELGNQTYGFLIPQIKNNIDAIKNEIAKKYKKYFKILIVHHPPNNWLNWEELYTDNPSGKSDFHNFIVDTDIDLVLTGHEHTSIVEGGLLFGKSLVLHGGMFLDHHEKDTSHLWYKTLEIENDSDDPIVKERWFHYSNADGGSWEESYKFSVQYQGWKRICKKINSHPKQPLTPVPTPLEVVAQEYLLNISSDADLKEVILPKKDLSTLEKEILDLLGFENSKQSLLKDGMKCFECRKDNSTSKLYIINNIDDFFDEYVADLPKESYLCALINDLDDLQTNVFVYYACDLSPNIEKVAKSRVQNLVQAKFEQFRHKLFRHDVCVTKLRNAKFAIKF